MLFHGAGAVGRIAVRGQEIPAYVAPPSSSQSFLTSLPSGWTLTRASANATNCTYLDGNNATTYTTYAANAPRFTAFGMLVEPGRTNIFLNSEAPVTQTITVALGPYIVWMLGTGSVVAAAGSAVGTGFGSATAGNFLSLVITTAGTITVTCTAPVTRVQVEGGTSPSSYIPTTSVAVSRSVELLSCSGASLNLAEGTYLVEFMLNGTPNTNGRIFMAGINPLGSALDADQMWMDSPTPRLISTVMDNAGNMPGYSQVPYTAPVFSVTRAAMAVSASHACSALNGVLGTAYGPTGLRPTAMTTLALMSGGGPPPINGILRSFKYWPVALNDAQLSAISAAGYFRDPPVFDLNFLSSVIPRRLSFLRSAGNAGVTITDGTINDASGAAYNTYGIATVAPTPRFNSQGLWLEPAHNNYYSTSNVPVTKTTAGMPSASSLILWVNGSGSAKISNGTGTVILDGPNDTATQGNPVRFSITPNNTTATITITGTLGRVQVEQVGPVTPGSVQSPTSFMQTAAAGLRGNEWLQMSPANWYNAEQHTYFIECIMLGYTNNPVPISVYYSNGEREQIFLQMVDGFAVPRWVAWGEKHQNNINYGAVGLQQSDVPINVVHRFAYSVNMSKRKLAMDGLVGPEEANTYSSGPSLYPTAFLINAQTPTGSGAGMMRVRRVQMYDYAMTDAEIASLTAGAGEALDLDFMQPGTMPAGLTFTRTSVGTYFDSAGVMQTAATGVARWDYDPVTHALRGLLVEEQRINILLNAATLVTQSVTVTATAYTLSFYGTGTVTLSGVATGTLVGVGAMPNRVTMTFTPTAGSLTLTVTGSVVSAQLEAGAFATSYIPTTTVAVTRIKELLTMPAGSFGSMFTGTMFVEGMQMGLWSKGITYFSVATTGKLGLIVQVSNQVAYFENAGLNQQMGEVPTGRPFKAAFSFTPTAQSGALDGVLSLANSYALPATTRSTIVVGTDTNVQQPNGYIRRAKIWTRTMPDDELIALTR